MDFADQLDMMDDDCDIEGFPTATNEKESDENGEDKKHHTKK